jgi:hypothetical protein
MNRLGDPLEHRPRGEPSLFAIFCFTVAAGLIVFAARGELWLDEVWSINFARNANGLWELATRFKHDNNHLLNTAYLYLLGPQNQNPYAYRLLALLCGIGSLFLLACIASREGAIEGVFTLLLAGSSYPMVLYFSEARGYAPAMFFALLAFISLRASVGRLSFRKVASLWILMILGILSHVTFAMVALGLLAWAIAREIGSGRSSRTSLARIGILFAPPFCFFVVFYLEFARDMRVFGGPIYPYRDVIGTGAAMLLGLPDQATFRMIAVGCYIALVTTGVWILARRRSEEWSFFLATLVLVPIVLVAVVRPTYLYFRYFVVIFPFFYLLVAYLLGLLFRTGIRPLGFVSGVLIGLLLVGQASRIIPFLISGRGSHRAALACLSRQSPAGELWISSDSEVRTMLSFYANSLPADRSLRYIDASRWPPKEPVWLVTRNQRRAHDPAPEFEIPEVGHFRLIGQFPYGGVSGWGLFLYRRSLPADHTPAGEISSVKP